MKTFKLVVLGMVLLAALAAVAQTSSNVSVFATGTTLEALSSDQMEIFMLPKVELGALFRLLGSASKQPGHQPDRVHTPAISRHGSQRYLPTAWSRR